MDRKKFIQSCGMVCLGGLGFSTLLQSCGVSKNFTGSIEDSDLIVPLSDFETKAGKEVHYKKYIIVHNDRLKFPICIYRTDAQQYSALWLRCTHQGAELQVFGAKLQCPAHGSEFNQAGTVTTGPAENNLRTFPVIVEANQLKISLKAL